MPADAAPLDRPAAAAPAAVFDWADPLLLEEQLSEDIASEYAAACFRKLSFEGSL